MTVLSIGRGSRRMLLAIASLVAAAGLASVVAESAGAAISVAITSPAAGTVGLGATVSVAVTASASVGVQSVQLYVDGKAYGVPDTTAVATYQYVIAWDTATVTGGMHTLTAVAQDWSGASQTSAPVSVGVGPPQSISLVSPPAWTLVHGKTTALSATVTAVSPATVDYAVDGVTVATVAAPPWSATFDSTSVADGPHTVSASLTAAGQTTSTSAAVTVDNTAPLTSVIAPGPNGYFTDSLPVQANASDAYGIRSVQFSLDGIPSGSPVLTPTTAGGYTYSATLTISALANGVHTLTELATDNAGNTTTSAAVGFTVGVAPLVVTITTPVSLTFATKTTSVQATVVGGRAPYLSQLSVDGKAVSIVPALGGVATFAWDTTRYASSTHALTVTTEDALGTRATARAVTVIVDNVSPTAVMYQPTPLAGYAYARTNGPTTFQVHASDGFGVKSVQFTVDGLPSGALRTAPDSGSPYLYTMLFDTSLLAPGLHAISAVVTDNAGNTSAATPPRQVKTGPLQYLPVLNYHGIIGPLDAQPDIYDQTAAQADAELAFLKSKGYQSVTIEQYQTWLTSGALPAGVTKPILLTVDDGLTDQLAWDALLLKYGFKAVLYVVTGFADNTTPGANDPVANMSWAQIQALAGNGRWQIGFHAGLDGHADFTDAANTIAFGAGQVLSYSTTCWLYYSCLGNVATTTGTGATRKTTTAPETAAQFQANVAAEVNAALAELKSKVPSFSPISWVCPWNDCGQWTNFYNDPSGTVQAWLPTFMASKFPIVFMQTNPITYGLASGTVGALNGFGRRYRFEVHTDTTIAQFEAALSDPAFANN